MPIFNPFPRHLAQSRLKSNLFLLLVSLIFRTVFTPYLTIRRGLIWLLDDKMGITQTARAVWLLETVLSAVLVWNAAEAAWSLYFPSPTTNTSPQAGKTFTPTAKSSPLTRPYASTPIRHSPNTPSQIASSSTPSRLNSTPAQSSPLASSVFGTPKQGTPSRTGLFYETDSRASPSKIAQNSSSSAAPAPASQSQAITTASTSAGTGPGGDFVMVEREEKEWVDNVWKGVRGKGGRKGL